MSKKCTKCNEIKELIDYKIINNNNKVPMWECLCSCGNTTNMDCYLILKKYSNSCGCKKLANTEALERWRKENGEPGAKPIGEAAFNRVLTNYKWSAKNKNKTFELSLDEFKYLILDKCHYCNEPPSREVKTKGLRKNEFKYNGIDRKDNNLGYTTSNCVTSCTECNFLKRDLDYNIFIKMILKIGNNLIKKEESLK